MEAADKGFFKDKTHPRPGPLHAIISMARNTQFSLDETVKRFFPQHEDVGERLPFFARKYAETKREANVLDYDDLLENRLPRIAQRSGLSLQAVEAAKERLRRLTTSPGRDLTDDDPERDAEDRRGKRRDDHRSDHRPVPRPSAPAGR